MTFRLAPEWEPHLATMVAWPADANLWQENLPAAQREWLALCRAITTVPSQGSPDSLFVLVRTEREAQECRAALAHAAVPSDLIRSFIIDYGDIWLRDTAPLFAQTHEGLSARAFRFNGWGEKYLFPSDTVLAEKVARDLKIPCQLYGLVTEGGALEWNDDDILLTTESCLVDEKRNPGLTKGDIERQLRHILNFGRILWIKRGMINDHTDGHIDTLVRFAPGHKILLMKARDDNDPQKEILDEIHSEIEAMAQSLPSYEIVVTPSPGQILDAEGEIMPASYMNFYVSNGAVIVPTYDSRYDDEAVQLIGRCFPDRKVIGLSARAILTGGGAFHCITQQIPLVSERL